MPVKKAKVGDEIQQVLSANTSSGQLNLLLTTAKEDMNLLTDAKSQSEQPTLLSTQAHDQTRYFSATANVNKAPAAESRESDTSAQIQLPIQALVTELAKTIIKDINILRLSTTLDVFFEQHGNNVQRIMVLIGQIRKSMHMPDAHITELFDKLKEYSGTDFKNIVSEHLQLYSMANDSTLSLRSDTVLFDNVTQQSGPITPLRQLQAMNAAVSLEKAILNDINAAGELGIIFDLTNSHSKYLQEASRLLRIIIHATGRPITGTMIASISAVCRECGDLFSPNFAEKLSQYIAYLQHLSNMRAKWQENNILLVELYLPGCISAAQSDCQSSSFSADQSSAIGQSSGAASSSQLYVPRYNSSAASASSASQLYVAEYNSGADSSSSAAQHTFVNNKHG